MSIQVTQLPDAEPSRDRHVAIGTFDGVHLGHQAVIDDADTVLTFDPHPLTVIHPEAAPKLIMSPNLKRDVIDGLGVEELVVITFDKAFSKRSAEDFIEHVLIEKLNAKAVSVGENFRFGAKAKGDVEMLKSDDRFETRVVPLVEVDGETVSSTRIRGAGGGGRRRARDALPRSAVHARGRGRDGRPAGQGAGFPDRERRPRRLAGGSGSRRLRRLRERPSGRCQRRDPTDVRDRPRPAGRGVPDRLRRRPLRPEPEGGLRGAPARREALPQRRGADGGDEPGCRAGAGGLRRLRARLDHPDRGRYPVASECRLQRTERPS